MPARDRPAVAFSTLGTPGWGAERVIQAARAWGFDGVEWRGGPEGTVRTDWSRSRRRRIADLAREAGLASIAVTAYSDLVAADPDIVGRSVDDVLRHAELANDLGAPTVRVFVGERSDDAADAVLVERAVGALERIVEAVRTSGVTIAIEPHDAHARSEALAPILGRVTDRTLGVVWDIGNAWAAWEDPSAGFAAYEERIAYVQVKDGTGGGESWRLCPVGRGDVPIARAVATLLAASPGTPVPPISIEWELAWHPELDPPEVALPAALAWLRGVIADQSATLGTG